MKWLVFPLLLLGAALAAADAAAKSVTDSIHAAEVASASAANIVKRIGNGERLFQTNCAACHQADGNGLPGAFPPLAHSDYLAANPMRAIEALLHGLTGPVTVNGQKFNSTMPSLSYLTDQDAADIVTFVVNSFGNKGGVINAAMVAGARGKKTTTDTSTYPLDKAPLQQGLEK